MTSKKEESLSEVIQKISFENDLNKEIMGEVLCKTIAEELVEYLNVVDENVKVTFEEEEGIKYFLLKEVTADEVIKDPILQVSLKDAQDQQKEVALGDEIFMPIGFDDVPYNQIQIFNRKILGKLKEIKNEVLYKHFKEKEHTIITGTFIRRNRGDFYLDIGHNIEGKLSYRERSPIEKFNIQNKIKCYLKEVSYSKAGHFQVLLSRTDCEFVKELFRLEIPEYNEDIIGIKKIVREPGRKTKLAVYSNKTGVEPVGTFVGIGGIRIKEVIKELQGEKIDIISYNDQDIKEYIGRSMQPGEVKQVVIINKEEKKVLVIVTNESYSKAIGKDGTNIKLASQLVEWDVSVRSEDQIKKNPDIMDIFLKVEQSNFFHTNVKSNIEELNISELILVKLLNANIVTVDDLYEKTESELMNIENMTLEEVKEIRKVLEESVEVVDDNDLKKSQEEFSAEFEDQIEEIEEFGEREEIQEEVEEVEYIVCPSCEFEFEYTEQTSCPSCKVEFEFEE